MSKQDTFFTVSRTTGLLYLGLAVSGMISYLGVRGQIFVDGNAAETLGNLITQETLSRIGIAAQVALVSFQALAGLWFYRLFRALGSFAALSLVAFSMVNAVAILIASAFWLSAQTAATGGATADSVYGLFQVHEQIWIVAVLFFGLWLIPMGYLANKARMPKVLAWLLAGGGVLYALSAFVLILLPEQKSLADIMTLPATIGEFWIVGYLLFKQPKV